MNVHITLLGGEALPLYYPIKQLKPDVILIICTSRTKDIAERLKSLLTSPQEEPLKDMLPVIKKVDISVTEAFDYKAIMEVCRKIHKSYPDISAENFTYNITGGTKIMTLAAFMIARELGANIIYTDSKNIKYLTTDDEVEAPLECRLKLHEIIALQGQKIRNEVSFNAEKESANLEASKKVQSFMIENREIYESLRKAWLGDEKAKDNVTIPNSIKFEDDNFYSYIFQCSKNKNSSGNRTLTIVRLNKDRQKEPEELLKITCPDPKSILLKGVWWELLVAEAISQISPEYEVWRNVEFKPIKNPDENAVKNEIDILVNIGNKLLFVECKSGKFNNDNVNKVSKVRHTYGGEKSYAVFVSAWPQDPKDKKNTHHENAGESFTPILAPSLKQGFASEVFLKTLPVKIKEVLKLDTLR